jgi:hypothetical protein
MLHASINFAKVLRLGCEGRIQQAFSLGAITRLPEEVQNHVDVIGLKAHLTQLLRASIGLAHRLGGFL